MVKLKIINTSCCLSKTVCPGTMPCLFTNLDFNEAAIEFGEFGLLWVRSLGVVSLTRTRYTDAETHWQNTYFHSKAPTFQNTSEHKRYSTTIWGMTTSKLVQDRKTFSFEVEICGKYLSTTLMCRTKRHSEISPY